jgi:hypothetical protein
MTPWKISKLAARCQKLRGATFCFCCFETSACVSPSFLKSLVGSFRIHALIQELFFIFHFLVRPALTQLLFKARYASIA